MFSLKIFAVLLLANGIFASPLFKIATNDDDDWKASMKRFFVNFAPGLPDAGVKPMDPMVVKNVIFPEASLSMITYFPELKVTGLKDVTINSFTPARDGVTVFIDLKYNLLAEGPVSLQFPLKKKDLKGTIQYEAVIEGTLTFPFATLTDATPKIAILGEPTYTCKASNAKYTIPDDFVQVLEKDPDASAVKAAYDKLHDEHVKKVACEINKAVFNVVTENLRALVYSEV